MATTTADSEVVSKAVALINKGGKLPVILGMLVKVDPEEEVPELSTELPKTIIVTEKIVRAAQTLGINIVGHQDLTVDERRPMLQVELDILSAERDAIDAIEKYLAARKEAHKVMLYNHWDAEIDEGNGVKPAIDAKGRYLTKVSAYAQGGSRHFDRQLAEGKPFVTEHALNDVAESGKVEGFDHQAYLECTTEVRVLDEEKTTIRMRTHAPTIAALREAAGMSAASSSFYHRDA